MSLKRLTDKDLDKIKAVKAVFEIAQRLTGVPWQAIAAVWYRESFSVASPKTPGGPFQFDPIPRPEVLDGLLQSFARGLSKEQRHEYILRGTDNFESGAVFCACWLRHNCKFDLGIDHSDTAIKDAFYGYNGRCWGPHPESSPYVYNNFDAQHLDMHIRGSVPDGKGGRKWIDNIDGRPGAFSVYRQIIDAKI